MKYAIIGSRTITDSSKVYAILDSYSITTVVSGGAKGVDSISESYAKENSLPTLVFKPDWKQYGRAAGPIRNKDIVENADAVIAFWDGQSKGTAHSIEYAHKLNKDVYVYVVTEDGFELR